MKNTIAKLSHADLVVGALTGLLVAAVAGLAFGALGALAGVFAALSAASGSQGRRAALQLRIDEPAQLQWDVMVNNVRVGTIADADYAALEKAVQADWRVYWAQGRNLAKAARRAGEMLIFAVPVALFWLGLTVVLIDPDAAAAIAEGLRTASGNEIVAAIDRYVRGMMLLVVVSMSMLAMFASSRLGYRDMFDHALGEAVRQRVQAATVGRMVLVPYRSPARPATV